MLYKVQVYSDADKREGIRWRVANRRLSDAKEPRSAATSHARASGCRLALIDRLRDARDQQASDKRRIDGLERRLRQPAPSVTLGSH